MSNAKPNKEKENVGLPTGIATFLKRHLLPCRNAKGEQAARAAQRSGSPTYNFFATF
ncbi:MAG: hypothetical protein RMZ43_010280 [Nostoc sp. CmiVER01]|uniref:hypothetical protein n=1 Tax=Nostoc sp. CmiVER01 TaxID=3075384 RepID=UPI002AD301DA|nr:hypothetical protein [Nostoc sp. CmiVER01]MDZ8122202.1 hypothetical protein [Nostoc sp. CmiVER01]